MHLAILIFLANMLNTASAQALSLIESSSFGYGDRVSPNGYEIPGWHVSGEGHVPELLSDKVILTPSYPGNVRGALWADAKVSESDWVADLEFRASGPDRGSGNLQIWYAKDGHAAIGTSSLYRVGKFDGLAIVVDQYGGKGGSIRGFMNDGNIDFKNHWSVDSLAFGHCDYSFRNLGRPIKLQIRQEAQFFEVIIDGRQCFASDKIRMPKDYGFGITAASAETPDSFEAYKFQLWMSKSVTREEPQRHQDSGAQVAAGVPVSSKSYDSEFNDLNKKLQSLTQTVEKLEREISRLHDNAENRHREVTRGLLTRDTVDAINHANEKLERIDRTINGFQSQFSGLRSVMKDSQDSLTEGLPKHIDNVITTNAPRMGVLIFAFVVIQVLLYGIYIIYKRRSKQGPKKYL